MNIKSIGIMCVVAVLVTTGCHQPHPAVYSEKSTAYVLPSGDKELDSLFQKALREGGLTIITEAKNADFEFWISSQNRAALRWRGNANAFDHPVWSEVLYGRNKFGKMRDATEKAEALRKFLRQKIGEGKIETSAKVKT